MEVLGQLNGPLSIHVAGVLGLVGVFLAATLRPVTVIAQRAGVKALVLTHFLTQIDQPGLRERIVQEVRQEFGGQVAAPFYVLSHSFVK